MDTTHASHSGTQGEIHMQDGDDFVCPNCGCEIRLIHHGDPAKMPKHAAVHVLLRHADGEGTARRLIARGRLAISPAPEENFGRGWNAPRSVPSANRRNPRIGRRSAGPMFHLTDERGLKP